MQGRPAFVGGFGLQYSTQGRVGLGHVVQAVAQGLEIKHGAADQQGQLAACIDLGDQPPGIGHKLRRAIGLQRVADIDQVVRHGGQFGAAGFGRAYVHAAVDQGRIDADDFDRVVFRKA